VEISCAAHTIRIFAIAGALAVPLTGAAVAQPHGPPGYDEHRPPEHRGPPPRDRGGYYREPDTGAIVGGALLGLAAGALVGGALAPTPPPPVYYAAPPPSPPPPAVYYGYGAY
jgi:hypothetical protein